MMDQHPDIYMSKPKELHFFDRYYDRGLDWYTSCFEPGMRVAHQGESTPFYMYNPTARRRMLTTLLGLKVICILRNPIDRAYSHYWHAREKGPEKSPNFEAALEREPRRLARSDDGKPPGFSYLDRGTYLDQLRPIGESLGRENLLVLLMDRLTSEPTASLLPSGRYPPMSDSTRQRLREHFAAMNAELSQWLGQDLSHWQ